MTKSIRFSFQNTPAGLRMTNGHPIQSTRALSGMNRVFTRLEQINKAAYEKVRHLDQFSVTLEQRPGSEKYSMRIFSQRVHIHIPNLKPETQKFFVEVPSLPLASSAPLTPDMMSSMGTPVFPQNLLVSFATALSAFWNWLKSLRGNEPKKVSFAPGTLDKPSKPLEPKRPVTNSSAPEASDALKEIPRSPTSKNMSLPVIVLDRAPEASSPSSTLDTPLPPTAMDRDSASDDDIYRENREYVDPASSKGQFLQRMTPDIPLKRYSHTALEPMGKPLLPESFSSDKDQPSIPESPSAPLVYEKLQLPISTRPKHRGCVILEQESIKTSVPVTIAPAAPQETPSAKEDDEFTILDSKETKPPVAIAAAEPIFIPPQISESERQLTALQSLFMVQFSSIGVQFPRAKNDNPHEPQYFGNFLLKRIFPMNDLQSCEMDMETGKFKLTFSQEKLISLTTLPKGKTEATINNLKAAVGTTLHIGKEIKGKFNLEEGEGYLEFEDGSLTLQWKSWGLPFTAHLLGIRVHPQDEEKKWLIFKGKLGATAERNIRAQDFIDFIECNIAK